MRVTIPPELDSVRIDQALPRLLPELTRSRLQNMIRQGDVFIDGKPVKKAHLVHSGNVVLLRKKKVSDSRFSAEKIPLSLLFEDDDILVVNKPPGIITHPTTHQTTGTLVNALLHFCGDRLSGIGGEKRPGIVHRLDRDTSGALMVAKNDTAHRFLSDEFRNRKVKKTYLTLLSGVLSPAIGSIHSPLLKSRGDHQSSISRVSASAKAQRALTHYKVRRTYLDRYSLVEVDLVTGRTHQIRVHFAAIGHPVMGDLMYGSSPVTSALSDMGLKRQFLHSHHLRFRHPSTLKMMEITAPLWEDLEAVLYTIGAEA